ncbi:MAG: hypothetical protein J6C37_05460, partial [Roseburia sp.]|nr:hypothetical protein [Roseburia sp.]
MIEWIANTLENLLDFSNILNESIAASWLILAVMILRLLLKRSPKWIHVALWGLVAVRLLLPFSMESALSLIPSTETLPREIMTSEGLQRKEPAYLEVVSNPRYSQDVTVTLEQSVDRMQVHMIDLTMIWLIGMAVLFLYTVISFRQLHLKISTAVRLRNNIFQSENVRSPFVLGIVRPRIYVSFHLNEQELEHVVAHEKAHIHRKDHWWKPLGFLLLTIHWFNPFMWLAYILFCRDIELACDEKVIKELNNVQMANYTQALLSCSIDHRILSACPLAFGEVGVKTRVKSVMNYRKPAFWFILLAVILCVGVGVCFLTNPKRVSVHDVLEQDGYTVIEQDLVEITLCVSKSALPDLIYTSEGYEFEKGEVVAYQTDSTTIYLHKAMLSNESDEQLYFVFDCDFDLSHYGNFLSPVSIDEEHGGVSNSVSLRSKDLRDSTNTYTNALAMRGHGPGAQFAFYVSRDACMSADESILIDIECAQIIYAKEGYEDKASQLLSSHRSTNTDTVVEMIPTTASLTGAFDSYLYIPLDGLTYRYERTDMDIDSVTKDKLIYSFTEEADPKNVDWKVYELKEYPDRQAVLAVAGADYEYVYQYSPSKRSEVDALDKAVESDYVVHMDGDVTSGQEIWETFVKDTSRGKAASVQLAEYYTLDEESCSEEYYEAYQGDYPMLFLFDLAFDGSTYTLKWKEGDKEYIQQYQYLMHYSGEAPTSQATYRT